MNTLWLLVVVIQSAITGVITIDGKPSSTEQGKLEYFMTKEECLSELNETLKVVQSIKKPDSVKSFEFSCVPVNIEIK